MTYQVTRWRGLVRVADADGKVQMVRRWTKSKASAEAQTREAGFELLAQFERDRIAAAEASWGKAAGETTTTVWDLIMQSFMTPGFATLAPKTQQDYRYASRLVAGTPLAAMQPRDVDVAAVRRFMQKCAAEHGSGGAKHARAVLSRAMNVAVETTNMRTPFNPVLLARDAIPAVSVRQTGLDHHRAPTDQEVESLLAALRADPEAGPMIPGTGRSKSGHGAAGTAPVNGKDIADLVVLLFRTGARIGQIGGLRWGHIDFDDHTISISGSLVTLNGVGTARQERTKTKGPTRTVPLADERAIKELFDRHGVEYGRGHLGRKWRVTSLVERGVPVHKTADLVGHGSIKTTFGYLVSRV